MNNCLAPVIAVAAATGLTLTISTQARAVEFCEILDGSVPAEEEFLWPDPEPASIDGDDPGSRVNVRTGPGTNHDAIAYGLVGDSVDAIGQAFDSDCETWLKVRFPVSEVEGWVHAEFVELVYARGLWD